MAIEDYEPYTGNNIPTVKHIPMTDEYAANYFMQQGYYAAKLDALMAKQKEESNGD